MQRCRYAGGYGAGWVIHVFAGVPRVTAGPREENMAVIRCQCLR